MSDFDVIRRDQLDALREIGNIGSGNAATALAQFLNRKIDMDVPQAKILPINQIPGLFGGPEARVLGIYLKVLGSITGRFMLMIPEVTAIRMLNILIPGCEITSGQQMGDMERSCMREIGNILAGSFLNALSGLTNVPVLCSLPTLAFDMAGALLDTVVGEMIAYSDDVLMIETSFFDDNQDLRMHIFLMPDAESIQKLFELLGIK
ncbi:MAG TPA: chemotaxis protein CheC [Candidatus Ozemobacteraceae bacterium]|nr:chemotaxis protein CheC [Candidatus Ozemobacteraceae bacterium]